MGSQPTTLTSSDMERFERDGYEVVRQAFSRADGLAMERRWWSELEGKHGIQGLREMRRVTRPGGTVAACVWDHAGDRGPLAAFWSAVRELDPAAPGESDLAGVREGQLASLFTQAGLGRTQVSTLTVRVRHADFDAWWQPFTLGVGPAGAYVASLTPDRRAALREQCRHLLPAGAVEVTAAAWAASGRA